MGLCFGGSESTVVEIEQKQFVEKCFFAFEYVVFFPPIYYRYGSKFPIGKFCE